ncbi:hypothetical protein [Spiroplasma citri]|uniref:Plectrovirus-related protein n=1 Tax=Spiroplasma citri TaxID=2133 RepID=A0AAX3SXU7_SPICI|nr:hypothetical protein [Spiroplasma citri]APE75315.1 plectrovirus-related protein [Spiroplasma citri]WFG95952.1 hypothetical protein M0C40_07560 [Spiroplasma citri]WFG99839.1 hypothetical protein M1771_07510 [Spiroplasma citri]
MINLLTDNVWNNAINVIVDIFMKIMDWMWALKLPGTNIPLFVIWVIGGVINVIMLLVNSSRGLSSVSQASLEASSSLARGVKGSVSSVFQTGRGMQKHFEDRKRFKNNRNKQQLSSLAKQAKTREQGFKRVHTTQRIKK